MGETILATCKDLGETRLTFLCQQFLECLDLPDKKPGMPYILGVIGQIGAGKTTASRMLFRSLGDAVHVQANTARYWLRRHGHPWGANVRLVVHGVAIDLLKRGYGVILDGGTAEAQERDALAFLGSLTDAPIHYIRIWAQHETCIRRTVARYEDQSWEDNPLECRVNTTQKMVLNIIRRRALHEAMDNIGIPDLIGKIPNDEDSYDALRSMLELTLEHLSD